MIILMGCGTICDQGSYHSLIEAQGAFYELMQRTGTMAETEDEEEEEEEGVSAGDVKVEEKTEKKKKKKKEDKNDESGKLIDTFNSGTNPLSSKITKQL